MGRNNNQFGKLWRDLFRTEEFCAKPLLDKVMFVLLITPDECDHAGLGRITVRRWLKPLAPATEEEIRAAMERLESAGDVYFDHDTEEFFVREFMARDRIGAVPLTLVSAAKSAAAVASPRLAGLLLTELMGLDIHDPKPGKTADQLAAALLAAEEHCQELSARLVEPEAGPPNPPRDPFGDGIGDPIGEGILAAPETSAETPESDPTAEGAADGSVVVDVGVVTSRMPLPAVSKRNHPTYASHLRVVREPELKSPPPEPDRGPDEPPPPAMACIGRCSVPCGRCADTAADERLALAETNERRAAAAAAEYAERWAKVDRCRLCDRAGELPDGRLCDHVDRTDIVATGRAQAWAALGGRNGALIERLTAPARRRAAPVRTLAATG
ncbi:hypothetical protein ACTD5D_32170 [Nocardia takedensis]|uniref:hypothetical protein n=1 Tax=Nocardia takedensis TaxID=259390 RepID=UPI003F76AC26